MENQNPDNQLQIELKEEVAQGTYANLAIITHSSSEFVLDFVRVLPGLPKAGVQSRVILAPEHAKRLQRALEENIAKYERAFGPIRLQEDGVDTPPILDIKEKPENKKGVPSGAMGVAIREGGCSLNVRMATPKKSF